MENDKPGGNQELPIESKRLSFLESWQQRLGLKQEQLLFEEESLELGQDKKDSKKSKNSKKWQSLFGQVFGGIVKPPRIETKPTDEQTSKSEKADTNIEQPTPIQAETPNTSQEEIIPLEEPAEKSSEAVHSSEPFEGEINIDHSEDLNHKQVSSETDPKQEPHEEVPVEQPAVELERPDNTTIMNQLETGGFSAENDRPREVKERVIERNGRGVGVAAGLFGLEFFGRKRADRKLQKEINKIEEELKRQKEGISVRTDTNETLNPRNEASKHPPPTESGISKPELASARSEAKYRTKAETQLFSTQETSSVTVQETEPKRDKERTNQNEKSEKNPWKVIEATEDNIPFEKLHERKNEIKDEPGKTVGAAPVSAILASSEAAGQSAFRAATKQFIDLQKQSSKITFTDQPEEYKQAIKNGFFTAVLLIVIAGILLLFTR